MYSTKLQQLNLLGEKLWLVAGQVDGTMGFLLVDTGCSTTTARGSFEVADTLVIDGSGNKSGAIHATFMLGVGAAFYTWEGVLVEELPTDAATRYAGARPPLALLGADWFAATEAVVDFGAQELRWKF